MGRHSEWRKHRLLQISRNEQITAYVPPDELIEAAQERTEGMVAYYREAVHTINNWKKEWDFLERLARSCYLQGARDTANVAAQLALGGSAPAGKEE